MLKLVFDIILAVFFLIPVLPVVVLSALIILCCDFQNPLFFQTRIGYNKKPFTIVKLRTMKNSRITTVGNILRKTGIDELPQLLNIISTTMSFVGPRPLTQSDIERLGWDNAYYKIRWNCRPGITGLAQLSPICHKKMSWFLDKKYLECRSFLLDIKIMLSSLIVLFVGKKKAALLINLKN